MKKIIVYYSFSGNNELLAKHLQSELVCDVAEVHEVRKRNGFTILLDILFSRTPQIIKPKVDISQYDRIIFLAPVWAGKIATPMKAFIRMENKNIKEYLFITMCGDGGNSKIASELKRLTGKRPLGVLELKVGNLLKAINKKQFSSAYKLREADLQFFSGTINRFVKLNANSDSVKAD